MHVLLGLLGLSRHHHSPQSPVKSTPFPWCVALQGCAGLGWDFTATSGASGCFLGATGGLCTAPVTPGLMCTGCRWSSAVPWLRGCPHSVQSRVMVSTGLPGGGGSQL